jgi:hypothetical protein
MNGSKNKYSIYGSMIQILNECHDSSDHTIKYFMPFFTTHLCETAFLLYAMTNTKCRNKLAKNMGSAVESYNSYSWFKQSLSRQASGTLRLRPLKTYIPSGHQATLTQQHSITSHMTRILNNTAVKNSNLTSSTPAINAWCLNWNKYYVWYVCIHMSSSLIFELKCYS